MSTNRGPSGRRPRARSCTTTTPPWTCSPSGGLRCPKTKQPRRARVDALELSRRARCSEHWPRSAPLSPTGPPPS